MGNRSLEEEEVWSMVMTPGSLDTDKVDLCRSKVRQMGIHGVSDIMCFDRQERSCGPAQQTCRGSYGVVINT